MSWPDRIFRFVTRLLPAEFRSDYGRELESTFAAARREAPGTGALVRLWAVTLADLARTAPGEHLDILRRDLRYSVRMFARRPALTVAATLTLALGIGANTAIFSVVDGVLLAPLPYADPDRLVLVEEHEADDEPGTTGYFSFDALRAEQQTFDGLAALAGWSPILAGDGKDAERALGARVSWDFFRTLGVAPALGRDFAASEDHPDRRRVALISDRFWRRRFNADPSVVGRAVTISQVTYTLVGVMPASLSELVTARRVGGADIWSPLGYTTVLPQGCRSCRHITVVGRLKDGVSVTQAQADLSRIYQSLGARFASDYASPRAAVTPLRRYFLGPVQRPLLLLWGAVALLLVMACANIANLLLIRASEREDEIAIRRALGVSMPRLVRQLVTEAMTLALLGGACGAVLARWGTALVVQHGPDAIPRLRDAAMSGRVLLYALIVSALTGLVFGMAPARALVGRSAVVDRGVVGRRMTSGPAAWRHRAWLIGVNVALSVVLLIGSGLLVRSFVRLLAVEPGFEPRGLLTLQANLSGTQYATVDGVTRFYDELTTRISRLPGVAIVTASTQLPLTGNIDRSGITIEGRTPTAGERFEADRYAVRPGFFAAMSIPLARGRLFSESDAAAATPVAIVGTAMAESLWPGDDPIGRRIRVAGGDGNPMRTIVGVVGDVRHYGFHMPTTPQVYIPHAQTPFPEPMATVIVRMADARDPMSLADAIRAEVRALDPLQPITQLRSYDTIVGSSLATRRFTLVLLAIFAATALVLALAGLYGALSYVVSQREREIGVRVAMGAAARDIRRLIVGQGMTPVAAGLLAGLALSVAAGRGVEGLLFDVAAHDALTFASVAAVIALGGLVACLLPARRAARVEPAVALRSQ